MSEYYFYLILLLWVVILGDIILYKEYKRDLFEWDISLFDTAMKLSFLLATIILNVTFVIYLFNPQIFVV